MDNVNLHVLTNTSKTKNLLETYALNVVIIVIIVQPIQLIVLVVHPKNIS